VACFAGVAPNSSFHLVKVAPDGRVESIQHVKDVGMRINGGFFVFRNEVFQWIRDGEELVQEPFQRLIRVEQLSAYRHEGFWACMDTFKDKQAFDDMYNRGDRPWEVWRTPAGPGSRRA